MAMSKENRRYIILEKASELVRKQGFNNTGIQEILDAVSIPKGSFYYYFKSKEDFGIQLIDYFFQCLNDISDDVFKNKSISPLKRLEHFFIVLIVHIENNECKGGCAVGNLAQELADLKETYREKLDSCFNKIKVNIKDCLEEAVQNKTLSKDLDIDGLANFILNSWQGAVLRSKVERSVNALNLFVEWVFGLVIKNLVKKRGSE
jgi:TetR/AcrR family transcriptional regulator, transcriptional repressor for nem operon